MQILYKLFSLNLQNKFIIMESIEISFFSLAIIYILSQLPNYNITKSLLCTYFFSPWIQPARSFVIFPESTVSTHAFSKTLQNL